MKEKIYEGKSLQEVEALAVSELGVAKDDLYFDVLTDDNTPQEEVKIHVMVDANPVKKGKDYLEHYLQNANIMGFVERKMRDNTVEYGINTENANGMLIGKNSRTLVALQYLSSIIVNQYFDRENENGLIVKVDVGDYRKHRDENLEKMATRIAKDVAKTKVPVKLHYMNAYERKVIHSFLQDNPKVETRSIGQEPRRRIVISKID